MENSIFFVGNDSFCVKGIQLKFLSTSLLTKILKIDKTLILECRTALLFVDLDSFCVKGIQLLNFEYFQIFEVQKKLLRQEKYMQTQYCSSRIL